MFIAQSGLTNMSLVALSTREAAILSPFLYSWYIPLAKVFSKNNSAFSTLILTQAGTRLTMP
jgi:hypothetical protein